MIEAIAPGILQRMLEKLVRRDIQEDPQDALLRVRRSVLHSEKIDELTHNFYKYPACFPPSFPREIIRTFSSDGDFVFDPFVGGGTSAVEAAVAGRDFFGFDINELAIFSSKFKTVLLSDGEISSLDEWSSQLRLSIPKKISDEDQIFFKNAPDVLVHFSIMLGERIETLKKENCRIFAKGALLRLAQIHVEHRGGKASMSSLLAEYRALLSQFLNEAISYRAILQQHEFVPNMRLHAGDFADEKFVGTLELEERFALAVTSPPYPQKHILYNKWQFRGRAETRLPYWIIGSGQVETPSFYTMGSRDAEFSLEVYLSHMFNVFVNANRLLKKGGLFVQMVAFSDKKRQFFPYQQAMAEAGFEEVRNVHPSSYDGRLWRDVPNRRWYNRIGDSGCKEVVLFHRKKRTI